MYVYYNFIQSVLNSLIRMTSYLFCFGCYGSGRYCQALLWYCQALLWCWRVCVHIVFLLSLSVQSALRDGINLEPPSQKHSGKPGVGNGWWTMAALGVGAFVVGALAIR